MRHGPGLERRAGGGHGAGDVVGAGGTAGPALAARRRIDGDEGLAAAGQPLAVNEVTGGVSHGGLRSCGLGHGGLPSVEGQGAQRFARSRAQQGQFFGREGNGAPFRRAGGDDHAEMRACPCSTPGSGSSPAGARRWRQCGRHQIALAHGAQFRHAALQHGARIENIDVALEVHALLLQHLARRLGVLVHLADHFAGALGQVVDIQGLARHQFGDERFFAQRRQFVDVVEIHLEEVPAQAFVKRRAAVIKPGSRAFPRSAFR